MAYPSGIGAALQYIPIFGAIEGVQIASGKAESIVQPVSRSMPGLPKAGHFQVVIVEMNESCCQCEQTDIRQPLAANTKVQKVCIRFLRKLGGSDDSLPRSS